MAATWPRNRLKSSINADSHTIPEKFALFRNFSSSWAGALLSLSKQAPLLDATSINLDKSAQVLLETRSRSQHVSLPRYVEGCAYFLSKVGEIMMLNPLEVFNVLDPLSARSLAN